MDQNSEISGYRVQYGPVDSSHKTTDTVTGSASTGGMHTVIGLIPSTNYSIKVAAVNSDGDSGPFTPSSITATTSISSCKFRDKMVSVFMELITSINIPHSIVL